MQQKRDVLLNIHITMSLTGNPNIEVNLPSAQ